MKEAKETQAEATVETAAENTDATEGREARLEKVAKHHILASMGVGLVPLPLVDIAALMGIQLNMIRKICAEYEVPFKEDAGKSIITSLIGGVVPVTVGFALASMLKFIPLIGQTTGAVTMPVISGASTYALYKVFVEHFEAGGTILDLDPVKVKAFFSEQFTKGKKQAADLKAKETAKTEA
ncbi:MAG: DUF697 domain-containing protein [Deltaproteobacteria bacterium]|nr:DUF697 domain-containing protein [Deltaproteobacteria bacterium]